MPFSPCLLDTNCWLYITPASSAPAQILHHIACLDPWNPGYRGRAYVLIPHDTFVFTILFVFQSTPCTSPKKELSKASQGLLGWIWRVSTWKRVQKRIEWEWSWWPQFQSEVKQFHPSFRLCVSRGVQLGPRANEISSHLRHWQPARPKRTTSVRIMRWMPCKCGCKNPRNIQPIQSYLLDKDSEMLELGLRKYMILPIHEHMCQTMLDFHTSSKSSIHAAWRASNIVPNERGACGLLPLNLFIQTDAIPSPIHIP